jgi:hypothetical protein
MTLDLFPCASVISEMTSSFLDSSTSDKYKAVANSAESGEGTKEQGKVDEIELGVVSTIGG